MIWREIPGFTSYEASECGDIRRKLHNQKIWPPRCGPRIELGQIIQPCGRGIKDSYLRLHIVSDDKGSTVMNVHVLVTMAFYGQKPTAKHCALHRDDNRNCNHYKNLYWGTKKNNAIDRSINGKHGLTKLNPVDVMWVWELYRRDKWLYREIAELYGVSTSSIAQIINGRSFTWIRPTRWVGYAD